MTANRTGKDQRADGAHPNSLAASEDPEIQRKIRIGRAAFYRDLFAMEAWAGQGFGPAIQEDDMEVEA